jgi:hypothetical protein
MADAALSFENQLADLVEWLFMDIEIPIGALLLALLAFIVLLFFTARKKDVWASEKGVVNIDLHANTVSIKMVGPGDAHVPPEITPDIDTIDDIKKAISAIGEKHNLLTLTLANSEGRPMASTSTSPDKDAAVAASVLSSVADQEGGWMETEDGSHVTRIIHRETPIFVHFRTRETPSDTVLEDILEAIKTAIERTLP